MTLPDGHYPAEKMESLTGRVWVEFTDSDFGLNGYPPDATFIPVKVFQERSEDRLVLHVKWPNKEAAETARDFLLAGQDTRLVAGDATLGNAEQLVWRFLKRRNDDGN